MNRPVRRGTAWSRPLAVVVLLAVMAGCGSDEPAASAPSECVEDPAAGEDLFPDKFEIRHADNLALSYHDTYKVLTVGEPSPGVEPRTYVLVQCGTDAPALEGDLAGATAVEIPVRSLYSQSTSHLGFVDALGLAEVVTGVSNAEVVVTPSVRERIEAGEVATFAEDYEVNTELVIAGGPDVFVTSGAEDPAHEVLQDAGVPVVANAEWLETGPLGWAEWIGFFAALTNTEAEANEVYADIEDRYEEAAARAADVTGRPTVIIGGLYEGDWYARGGAGIVPQLIADAGGDYVYADDPSTGSLILDLEQVLADAHDSEVWIGPLGFTSRAEAEEADGRYTQFAAWEAGGVWNTTRQADDAGGNAYFDQGPVQIDDILLDLVKILHPDLAADHELVFYEQVS